MHGEEEAKKAEQTAKALFVQGGDTSNMPATELTAADLTEGAIGVLDLMVKCDLAPSQGEARRLVQQGGVSVDGEKVTDIGRSITAEQLMIYKSFSSLSRGMVFSRMKNTR